VLGRTVGFTSVDRTWESESPPLKHHRGGGAGLFLFLSAERTAVTRPTLGGPIEEDKREASGASSTPRPPCRLDRWSNFHFFLSLVRTLTICLLFSWSNLFLEIDRSVYRLPVSMMNRIQIMLFNSDYGPLWPVQLLSVLFAEISHLLIIVQFML
jgi:hypothetical protein